MKNLKRILYCAAMALVMLASTGCASVKDIAITSCAVEALSPRGLKAVDAVLALGIDNPVFGFKITWLDGVIRNGERTFATFNAEDISVDRRSVKIYSVPCTGALDKSVSLMELLRLASSRDFSSYVMDVDVHVKLRWGPGTTLHFKDMSISEMMETSYALEILEKINEALI